MKFKKLLSILTFAGVALGATAKAEESPTIQEIKDRVDGIDENVSTLLTDVAGLKKLKISGYVQVQFEKTENMKGFSKQPITGSDSTDVSLSRFNLRRSRMKFNYDAGLTQVVVQGDFSNTGFALKDAYLQITDPWTKFFTLTAGIFNRPNFEVEYSSSQRESMERSQMIQKLYPGERDFGAMITFEKEEIGKLQLAAFNNTIGGTFTAGQNLNNYRDFPLYYMARFTRGFELTDDLVIDLGAHARFGSIPANSLKVVEGATSRYDTTSASLGDAISRTWFGGEMQLYWDFLGGTKLMGEIIAGNDADYLGVAGKSAPSSKPVYKRSFLGYYAMLVKNLGFIPELEDFQLAFKYDFYNPNTKIDHEMKTSTSELESTWIGFGLHNYSFQNIRLSLWYDMKKVKEQDKILKTAPIDNQLTLRLQYKF